MFIDSRIVLVSMKSSEVSQNLPIMQAHRPMVVLFRLSGNLVGISINLCKSKEKEFFINDTP